MLADGDFDGTIDNFVAGDTIDLQGIGLATSATLDANNLLTITGGSGGPITLQLDASEDYTGFVFRLKSDGNGGTTITLGKNVNGGNGNDSLTGTDGDDVVNGGNGNDTLTGLAGDDILNGGNGNDIMNAGAGNDVVSGGNGDDTIDGGEGNDSLDGGNGNDIMAAGDGNDSLSGGNGDDVMDGGADNDSLSGGNGNDTMTGGDGNDNLSGGNGNDIIVGGAGDDVMSGGNGNDLFAFEAGFGEDTITGFQSNDRIQLDDELFADFASVIAASQQVGANTVITLDADNTITLQNVQLDEPAGQRLPVCLRAFVASRGMRQASSSRVTPRRRRSCSRPGPGTTPPCTALRPARRRASPPPDIAGCASGSGRTTTCRCGCRTPSRARDTSPSRRGASRGIRPAPSIPPPRSGCRARGCRRDAGSGC